MSTKKIIGIVLEKCAEAEERAPDYRKALLDTVSDIVWAEHLNSVRSTPIQKIVTDYCQALGDFIERNTGEK